MMTWRDELVDENPDALTADGFDDAFLGFALRCGQPTLVAYDYDRCIDVLVGRGMSYQEAVEFFEFNVAGAWMGEHTPLFVRTGASDD